MSKKKPRIRLLGKHCKLYLVSFDIDNPKHVLQVMNFRYYGPFEKATPKSCIITAGANAPTKENK